MLRFLHIKSLAVIDAVEVEFGRGLNVLTGETGAGKSILVEAVGLLLGGRASADLVRTGEEMATVEAIFNRAGETDGEVIVRREITAQGRSRAFVNGELTTASALRDLAAPLVELHGQHEHQTLLDPASHLDVLDAFGGLASSVDTVAAAYARLRTVADTLAGLRQAAADRSARQEFVAFQLTELERASLKAALAGEPSEDVELAALRLVLADAERIERLCAESYAALYESDDAVLGRLRGIWRRVGELAAVDPRFQPYIDARDGIKSQLEDLALFLRRYADGIDTFPARLHEVEERLALLERLKRKYGGTLDQVIARRNALRQELADLEHVDERLEELEREHASARAAFLSAASTLGAARRQAAAGFSRRLEQVLATLAMHRTKFEVRFARELLAEGEWSERGIDRAEFFVSPNPGEDLRPLARIVSGGELSRIMLAIKTLAAESKPAGAPGLIFDEVDAGIGGRVADAVGRRLHTLSRTFQVLCITHLPQIAAAADTHFQIEKRVERGRTRTFVARLDDNGRVEELGRMLGGTGITDAVRASAREMIARHRDSVGGESERAKAKGR